jgi:hypothetical protein
LLGVTTASRPSGSQNEILCRAPFHNYQTYTVCASGTQIKATQQQQHGQFATLNATTQATLLRRLQPRFAVILWASPN